MTQTRESGIVSARALPSKLVRTDTLWSLTLACARRNDSRRFGLGEDSEDCAQTGNSIHDIYWGNS
jgi:hypothetical protein